MVETQVTEMVIKVDLGCDKCHKKIKKVLCAIPQIQNQAYDKKKNTVTITVVCCCPEKIKTKIYCKGGKAVKCIEIPPPTIIDPPTTTPTIIINITPPATTTTPPPPCTCCEKCRGGPCCHHFCVPIVPPYCYVPCRRSECDIWGDGCCSCRSRGYYVCRSVYVCEDYPPKSTPPPSPPKSTPPPPKSTPLPSPPPPKSTPLPSPPPPKSTPPLSPPQSPKPEPPPCKCCEKCRRGPCCNYFCMPIVPPYCYAPCRRSECDIWGDGCCSCRSRGYSVCRSVYVYEEYYTSTCKIM
ncbi:protein PYRICULARIA ORYZAE RESISTANCE 21-like isoform X1 [Populus alba x Populus x berolinensis]|nr:protein PYRICULARIA ORYZAE RESISTANCE 21-like isoform X1 [Populus alba x Populus x berolinensis]